jgi:Lar family restriction alleviation protein
MCLRAMLLPMEKPLDCPFCASDDLDVTEVDQDCRMLAVFCNECGAQGPLSLCNDRAHAIHSWNQRPGRLSLVKRQWQRL